jgi:DNA-binding helix-hairpin-helix protein with protein kinase domain
LRLALKLSLSHKLNNTSKFETDLDNVLGRGGTAFVYKVMFNNKYYTLKLYHENHESNKDKLLFLINNPPHPMYFDEQKQDYPLYSWPISLVYKSEEVNASISTSINLSTEFKDKHLTRTIGFISPLIDDHKSKTLDFFYDYTLSKRLKESYNDSLSFKIRILRNLAKSISNLHQLGVYVVDIKPQNIRVFEGTNIVSILDCDSFQISAQDNASIFKADMISAGYIAPEFLNTDLSAASFGENQDLYALAVIIFQLMNKGIHPFQGIINDHNITANTNDEKAAAGLYPYGIIKHPSISPKKESIHQYFLPTTRLLFDRAFIPGKDRPSASEWFNHFESILSSKDIVRCKTFPDDTNHMHFRSMPCTACAIAISVLRNNSSEIPNYSQSSNITSFRDIQHMYPATIDTNDTSKKFSISSILLLCLGIFGALLAIIFAMEQQTTTSPSTGYSPSQNQYAPSPSYYEEPQESEHKSTKPHTKARKKDQSHRSKKAL